MFEITKIKAFIESIHLNLISIANVGLGFMFIVMLGRKLGIGNETDIYFYSLVVVSYLEKFISVVWLAIKHYYVDFKVNDNEYLNDIYIILLNNIVISSLIIITIYYSITGYFYIFSEDVRLFMNIFIFYILIHSIFLYNKKILNLEHQYISVYLVDSFVHVINLLTVIFFVREDAIFVAYSTLFATSIVVLWQLRYIFKLNNFRYKLIFYNDKVIKELFKNSFKLTISDVLYSSKDIFVVTIFSSFGSGILTLYSYANKFIGVISQVVTTPLENVYTAKVNEMLSKNKYKTSNSYTKKTIIKNTILFLLAILCTYLVLPYALTIMLGDQGTLANTQSIQQIFILLGIFSVLGVVELPFRKVLNVLRMFNLDIFKNLIFFVIISLGYIAIVRTESSYMFMIVCIIIGQLAKVLLSLRPYKQALSKRKNNAGVLR